MRRKKATRAHGHTRTREFVRVGALAKDGEDHDIDQVLELRDRDSLQHTDVSRVKARVLRYHHAPLHSLLVVRLFVRVR